jgi:general stress protein YciG
MNEWWMVCALNANGILSRSEGLPRRGYPGMGKGCDRFSTPQAGIMILRLFNKGVRHMSEGKSGKGWHGDSEGHAAAGRKGGSKVSQDRDHMAEIGKRGGSKVAEDREHMAEIGRKGGSKMSQDRQHMAEIGKRGGQAKSQKESG